AAAEGEPHLPVVHRDLGDARGMGEEEERLPSPGAAESAPSVAEDEHARIGPEMVDRSPSTNLCHGPDSSPSAPSDSGPAGETERLRRGGGGGCCCLP